MARTSVNNKRLPEPAPIVRLSRQDALRRTKRMVRNEWALASEPLSDTSLSAPPPAGLGKNSLQLRALETPVETCYFADVKANVAGHDLAAAQTVGGLRDVIWNGIPANHRQEVMR